MRLLREPGGSRRVDRLDTVGIEPDCEVGCPVADLLADPNERDPAVTLGVLEPALRLAQKSGGFLPGEETFHGGSLERWPPMWVKLASAPGCNPLRVSRGC